VVCAHSRRAAPLDAAEREVDNEVELAEAVAATGVSCGRRDSPEDVCRSSRARAEEHLAEQS
jgi:hypothetical protein